jgi:2-haloacid dehalogenase
MVRVTTRALVFDVFGTVVDWRSGVARDAGALAGRLGVTGFDGPAFADAWRRRYEPSLRRVAAGELPWTNLDGLHAGSLAELAPEHGLAPTGGALDPGDADWLVRAWHRLDPWPDAVQGLDRLRRRFTLAPLSNGGVALLTAMAKRAGLPWDLILSAELVRAYKPDPATYLSAPRWLDLRPEQVMMVAAHADDLVAARAQGLRTAFVRRPLEWGEGGPAEREPGPDEVDLVVDSFPELAERLDA